jgi:hypothetical protein
MLHRLRQELEELMAVENEPERLGNQLGVEIKETLEEFRFRESLWKDEFLIGLRQSLTWPTEKKDGGK